MITFENVKTTFSSAFTKLATCFSALAARISNFVKSFFAKKAEQPTTTPAPIAQERVQEKQPETATATEQKTKNAKALALPAPEPEPDAEPKPTPTENAKKLADFQRKHAPKKTTETTETPAPRRSARLAAKKK